MIYSEITLTLKAGSFEKWQAHFYFLHASPGIDLAGCAHKVKVKHSLPKP